jgi:hypothetical protein
VIDRTLIRLNNIAVRLRRTKCKPEELLVLLSRCLQRSACDCKIVDGIANCRRCGQCVVAQFAKMAEKTGVQVFMATGGRQAAARAAQAEIKAIVAVACEKELRAGIFASLPKAVYAQTIEWPCGACKDTTVSFDQVERAVRWFLR